MRQYLTLLRVFFKKGELAGAKKSNKVVLAVCYAILAITFGGMMAMFGGTFAMMTAGTGGESAMYTLVLTGLQGLLLVFGIILLLSVMYFSRDNEMLLSYPVKNSTIFFAKITSVYLYLFVIGGALLLCFAIPFGILCGFGAGFWLMLIPQLLLLPFAALFVSTLLSFPVMYIAAFVRKNRYVTTILIILGVALFAGLYIWIYGGLLKPDMAGDPSGGSDSESVMQLTPGAVQALNELTDYLFFNKAGAALSTGSSRVAADIAIYFGTNIGFFALSYFISVALYRKGMAKQLESGNEVLTRNKELSVNSPGKALFRKEMKLIFRNPLLLFYTLFEFVMPVVLMIIIGNNLFFAASGETGSETVDNVLKIVGICMALLFGMTFACGTNYVALSSVSREGKNFFMMKLMPVPVMEQLEIKGRIACVLPIISLAAISVWLGATGAIGVFSTICYFVFTSVLSYGLTYYQMGLDIKTPRLDYENFSQLMQNNSNALKSMGINFLFALAACLVVGVVAVLSFVISNMLALELILWGILLVCAGVSAVLLRRSYLKNAVMRFEQIEP